MGTFFVRFPDGTKECRYTDHDLEEGDALWHDGVRFRVREVEADHGSVVAVTVEPDSNNLVELPTSERGEGSRPPMS